MWWIPTSLVDSEVQTLLYTHKVGWSDWMLIWAQTLGTFILTGVYLLWEIIFSDNFKHQSIHLSKLDAPSYWPWKFGRVPTYPLHTKQWSKLLLLLLVGYEWNYCLRVRWATFVPVKQLRPVTSSHIWVPQTFKLSCWCFKWTRVCQ